MKPREIARDVQLPTDPEQDIPLTRIGRGQAFAVLRALRYGIEGLTVQEREWLREFAQCLDGDLDDDSPGLPPGL